MESLLKRVYDKGGYRISLRVLRDFEKGKYIFLTGKKGKFSIDRAKAKIIVHIFALKNYLLNIRSDSNVLFYFFLDFILMFLKKKGTIMCSFLDFILKFYEKGKKILLFCSASCYAGG